MTTETKKYLLDFEKPIAELEEKLAAARAQAEGGGEDAAREVQELERRIGELQREIYSKLSPWERVLLARHPDRPYTWDYVQLLFRNPIELHGDRLFRDDQAIICGFGWLGDRRVCWLGHEKGRKTAQKIKHNFGSPHPEGYRKAMRVMRLADRFGLPIVAFLDTAGAYPGIGAEERGQAEAIARNILDMYDLGVPVVVAVVGEGGSGGALGIGVGNRVIMQEHSYYSVISPEGCAAILWRDRKYAPQAVEALKVTAQDLFRMGIVDEVVPEPPGGAHRDWNAAAQLLGVALNRHLDELARLSREDLKRQRREKFLRMGFFEEKKDDGAG